MKTGTLSETNSSHLKMDGKRKRTLKSADRNLKVAPNQFPILWFGTLDNPGRSTSFPFVAASNLSSYSPYNEHIPWWLEDEISY